MHRRLEPLNVRLLAVVAVLLFPFAGTVDHPAALLIGGLAMIVFGAFQRRAPSFARPELWVFGAVIGACAAIGCAAAIAEPVHDAALLLLGWPVAGLAGRFRGPVAAAGTAIACVIAAASQLAGQADGVAHDPLRVTLPVGALVCIAVVVYALRESDVEHRGAANVDALTTLLNRRALMLRVRDLEQQSQSLRQPVAVILIDLDFFKLINDVHGHGTGDRVLQHVGTLIRRELRAYDLAYRLGGEEFVVLMPGATADVAFRQAEHLREAIEQNRLHDLQITASIGVSATTQSETFSWESHFAAADQAVYSAKRAGRNRVVSAHDPGTDPG